MKEVFTMVVKRMNKKEFLEAYEKHKDVAIICNTLYIAIPALIFPNIPLPISMQALIRKVCQIG